MQRLRGDHGQHGERGIEQPPGTLGLAPRQEHGRSDVVLPGAGIAAVHEGALRSGLGELDVAGGRHGHVADMAAAVALARLPADQQHVGQLRNAAIEQLGAMPLAQQAQVGPDRRQVVECRARHGVVITARGDATAKRMIRVGWQVNRIVGNRGQRGRRGAFGGRHRAMRMAEHARHDAIADRRLVVSSTLTGTFEQPAQTLQHRRLVGVAPEHFERRVVVFERGPEGLDRQRECLQYELQAMPRGQRGIGDQGRAAGRAVDQRAAFLDLQIELPGQLGEQRIEGQDLACAPLAGRGHLWHRSAIEHLGHGLGNTRRGGGMSFDEITEAGQHDAAHEPIGQVVAKGGGGRKGLDARVALTLLLAQGLGGQLSHRGRDAIDHDRRVVLDQIQKRGAGGRDALHRGIRDPDVFAAPGDPIKRLQRDIPSLVQHHRHLRSEFNLMDSYGTGCFCRHTIGIFTPLIEDIHKRRNKDRA